MINNNIIDYIATYNRTFERVALTDKREVKNTFQRVQPFSTKVYYNNDTDRKSLHIEQKYLRIQFPYNSKESYQGTAKVSELTTYTKFVPSPMFMDLHYHHWPVSHELTKLADCAICSAALEIPAISDISTYYEYKGNIPTPWIDVTTRDKLSVAEVIISLTGVDNPFVLYSSAGYKYTEIFINKYLLNGPFEQLNGRFYKIGLSHKSNLCCYANSLQSAFLFEPDNVKLPVECLHQVYSINPNESTNQITFFDPFQVLREMQNALLYPN